MHAWVVQMCRLKSVLQKESRKALLGRADTCGPHGRLDTPKPCPLRLVRGNRYKAPCTPSRTTDTQYSPSQEQQQLPKAECLLQQSPLICGQHVPRPPVGAWNRG